MVSRTKLVGIQRELLRVIALRHEDHRPEFECWACGEERTLEKAHVVARAAGGSDDPSNLWLLCRECHEEQPDGASPESQHLWLITHETGLERAVRVTYEIVAPIIARPRGHEYAAVAAPRVAMVFANVRARIGRANRVGVRNSIRFELLADYERWLTEQGTSSA